MNISVFHVFLQGLNPAFFQGSWLFVLRVLELGFVQALDSNLGKFYTRPKALSLISIIESAQAWAL